MISMSNFFSILKNHLGWTKVRNGAVSERVQASERGEQRHEPAGAHHQWSYGQYTLSYLRIRVTKSRVYRAPFVRVTFVNSWVISPYG